MILPLTCLWNNPHLLPNPELIYIAAAGFHTGKAASKRMGGGDMGDCGVMKHGVRTTAAVLELMMALESVTFSHGSGWRNIFHLSLDAANSEMKQLGVGSSQLT